MGDIYIPPPVQPYCSNESVGARLIITNILNRDFKSYAGDVELGPFTHVSIHSAYTVVDLSMPHASVQSI